MNAVAATTPVAGAVVEHAAATPQSGGDSPSLLPEPSSGALGGADPLSMLYLFESRDQTIGLDEGTKKIQALQTERHQALEQEQQAIQQAAEASKHHDFWDTLGDIFGEVAKVAAVVASVAAAVATLGAATPIAVCAVAGAVLSTASFADGELHVLRAFGVDDQTAGWIDMGMSMGGAGLSVGAAIAAAGTRTTLSAVDKVVAVVGGAGEIGKGACTIEAGEAQASADQAEADQVAAGARSDQAQRRILAVIADTQTSNQQSERIMETITNTKAIQNETSLGAVTAVRG